MRPQSQRIAIDTGVVGKGANVRGDGLVRYWVFVFNDREDPRRGRRHGDACHALGKRALTFVVQCSLLARSERGASESRTRMRRAASKATTNGLTFLSRAPIRLQREWTCLLGGARRQFVLREVVGK